MDDLDSLLEDLNENTNDRKKTSTKIDLDELDDLMNDLNNESDNSHSSQYHDDNDYGHTNQSKDVSDELDDLLDGLSSINDNPPPKPTKQPVKQTPPTKTFSKQSSYKQSPPIKQSQVVDSTLDDLDLLVEGLNTNPRSTSSQSTYQSSNSGNTLDELDELMNGLDAPPRQSNLQTRQSNVPTKNTPPQTRQSNVNSQRVMPSSTQKLTDDLDDLLLDMDSLSNDTRSSTTNNSRPSQSQNYNQGGDDLDDLLGEMDNLTVSQQNFNQQQTRPSQQNFQQQPRPSQQNFQQQTRPSQQNFQQQNQMNRPSQQNFQQQTRPSQQNFQQQNQMNRPSQQNFQQQNRTSNTSGFQNNQRNTQVTNKGGDDLDDLLGDIDNFQNNRQSNTNTTTNTRNTNFNSNNFNNNTRPSMHNNMNVNQVQNGPQRGICGGCNQPIYGQILQALGRSWHPEHFVCGNCSNELGTSSFFEQEGKPHCENCYQNLFCPRCAACDQPITQRVITALGKKWHPEHFVCTTCNSPFGGGSFYERGGYPYCQEHYYNSSSASKCAACQQTIQGDCVNAIGQQWHTNCFVCQYCQKSFTNGQFYEMNGMPYCEIHYYSNTGSMCGACNKPITGKAVNALGRSWHPEHFVCGFCYNSIGGGNYTEKDDKAFCSECYSRLYG
eukprot:TRINITY_DN5_c0_g1_i1.p1 TRINITY_DN5_c0_g1~~TRINITY_DN5_c0_g1_i1.p1  ORF type:complete len:662 (-),score=226.75 TRINITY_DN5_c0_g1_i1:175-2160(-)